MTNLLMMDVRDNVKMNAFYTYDKLARADRDFEMMSYWVYDIVRAPLQDRMALVRFGVLTKLQVVNQVQRRGRKA